MVGSETEDLTDLTLIQIQSRLRVARQNADQILRYIDQLDKEVKRRAGFPRH